MQAAGEDVAGADVMTGGHDEVRQLGLGRDLTHKRRIFAGDTVRPEHTQEFELCPAGVVRPIIGQINDLTLGRPVDRTVGLVHKTTQVLGMPVIAPRLPLLAIHALLHHSPFSVIGDEETVKIELESILHGRAVDLGDQPAGAYQRLAIDAGPLADRSQLIRRAARMLAAPAADVNAELALQRRQPALQGANHASGNAGRVPVHAHHGAKRLEPERMRQPLQEFVAPIVMHPAWVMIAPREAMRSASQGGTRPP
jgi:hypothetical protein